MSDITTNLTQSSTIVGSVSQGNQPQVVRVTTGSNANAGLMSDSSQAEVVRVSVPGPQGPTGSAGSSANNIFGCAANALAIATLCCSPPERLSGHSPNNLVI